MKILVTGAAGFIGAHTTLRLLQEGHEVIGLDNFNDYYDPQLKEARVRWVRATAGDFTLYRSNLEDDRTLEQLFATHLPDAVIHLAAQAGVRYSLDNPRAYLDSNLAGFLNLLEACRRHPVNHLIFASSSSVYGANHCTPYSEQHNTDHPLSLYAASKKANEVMAHSYSHLFGIPATGLRFFTVYGPWGRPDMSPMLFANAISYGQPVKLFNHGEHQRDFTYIDDIVESLVRLLPQPPSVDQRWNREEPNPSTSMAPWRLYNIGGNRPVHLRIYVDTLARLLGRPAELQLLPLQPGDVINTCADASALEQAIGFTPLTRLEDGLERFVAWFRDYYLFPVSVPVADSCSVPNGKVA
ncbi:NAD-dependent epimerase [Marinobacter sp.]|uniref:NAD-dependent epimerase n=1 Tax=Pseudomonadales TaxID=72274 RepID=UPI003A915A78|nr:NAD-dependent epimerase [Gammaproteobacteria bacterium]MBU1773236.1 NAD-dependent epimerase [Gammaproteobacteria bacterium]